MTIGCIGNLKYKTDENTGCFICISHKPDNHGYPSIKSCGSMIKASRYVYALSKGSIPEGYIVRHTCDNTMCINPDHLIVGTHIDNVADRVSRNRSATGCKNGRSKLSEKEVIDIYFSKETPIELSKKYNIDPHTIYYIWNKKNWLQITKTFLPMYHRKSARTKLNESDIINIYKSSKPSKFLEEKYGRSRRTIYNIRHGIYFKSITKQCVGGS